MPAAEPTGQHELAAALGVELGDALLRQALTHRSYAYEHPGQPHNERLEFLGDSVLGVVVTDTLYRQHPDLSEGRLAKLRASVVNMRALADVAREIGPQGLGAYIWLGRGEQRTGGRGKASILADTTEAVIGAVYLQHGLDVSARVIHALFDDLLHAVATNNAGVDWKTALQEYTAAHGLGVPDYLMSSVGPDHEKLFTARASVQGVLYEACTGHSKKEAEQGAAQAAWRALSGDVDTETTAAGTVDNTAAIDAAPLATTAAAPPEADADSTAAAG